MSTVVINPALIPEEVWAPLAEQIAIAGCSLVDSHGLKIWSRGPMEALPELVREAVGKWVGFEVILENYPQSSMRSPLELRLDPFSPA